MKSFNFFRIDCIRCKKQLALVAGMMVLFSVIFTVGEQPLAFILGYLLFLSVAFSGQPFSIETLSESGFIDMLPGTKRQRVGGRFLYAIAGVMMAVLVGGLIIIVYQNREMELPQYVWQTQAALTGVALFMVAVEMTCLYVAGRGRSQQFITLILVGPSMLMFFVAYGVIKYIPALKVISVDWILENATPLACTAVAVGVVAMVIAYIVANSITQHRDYA